MRWVCASPVGGRSERVFNGAADGWAPTTRRPRLRHDRRLEHPEERRRQDTQGRQARRAGPTRGRYLPDKPLPGEMQKARGALSAAPPLCPADESLSAHFEFPFKLIESGRRLGHNVFGCKTKWFCRGVSAKSDALQFFLAQFTPGPGYQGGCRALRLNQKTRRPGVVHFGATGTESGLVPKATALGLLGLLELLELLEQTARALTGTENSTGSHRSRSFRATRAAPCRQVP